VLDFKELGGQGQGLEQLVRETLLLLDLHPQWSGVGPDGGRDLLFTEPGMDILGKKSRTWLVSCKDKSTSGAAVGVEDLGYIVETTRQHNAQGFLLVCTTHPSTAALQRLTANEANSGGTLTTHYWDGVTLERILSTPRMWAVAQQFMPKSTGASGWKIFATQSPHQWVAVHRGHYFHLSNRIGGNDAFDLPSLDRRMEELQALESEGGKFRLRGIWLDDAKGGGYTWYVDYMIPTGQKAPDPEEVEERLQSGMAREDHQYHSFQVVVRTIEWGRDHFDMDHYNFYRRLPSYV